MIKIQNPNLKKENTNLPIAVRLVVKNIARPNPKTVLVIGF
jgi:hypothetical protein